MARRFRGEMGVVGATCLGDEHLDRGVPRRYQRGRGREASLVIVVANNQYAYSTPNDRQFACQDLLDKAVGYGVAGHRLEATDWPIA